MRPLAIHRSSCLVVSSHQLATMAPRVFFFICLTTAACCLFCLALLPPPPPAQGRPGLQQMKAAGGLLGGRRLHLLPVPEQQQQQQQQRAVPVRKKTRPAWSPASAAGSVTPELRAVPGGPDPLHHHGGSPSRRPDQDRTPSP